MNIISSINWFFCLNFNVFYYTLGESLGLRRGHLSCDDVSMGNRRDYYNLPALGAMHYAYLRDMMDKWREESQAHSKN